VSAEFFTWCGDPSDVLLSMRISSGEEWSCTPQTQEGLSTTFCRLGPPEGQQSCKYSWQ
jgi:hypothetical protein